MHYIQFPQIYILRWRQSHPIRNFFDQVRVEMCAPRWSQRFPNSPQVCRQHVVSLPSLSSTFLSERGTLINSGIFSSNRPRLGLSLSVGSISTIFSVQNFSNSTTSKIMLAFPASGSKKGCKLSPSLQTHINIFPFSWALISLLPELGCDVRRDPRRISYWRISSFPWFSRYCLEPSPLAIPVLWYTLMMTMKTLLSIVLLPMLSDGTSGRWYQISFVFVP